MRRTNSYKVTAICIVLSLAIALYYWTGTTMWIMLFFKVHSFAIRYREATAPMQHINWKHLLTKIPTSDRQNKDEDYRPNIILIVADDLGINDLYGKHLKLTRNIRSIAERGVNLTHAYAGHATCAPSRASMLTGQYSTRFGFEFTPVPPILAKILDANNGVKSDAKNTKLNKHHKMKGGMKLTSNQMSVPKNITMLQEYLQNIGYTTLFFGKWHLGGWGQNLLPHQLK